MKKTANKAPKAPKAAAEQVEETKVEEVVDSAPTTTEEQPKKPELDPDRPVELNVNIQGRFKFTFPKSMPQDERIRVVAAHFCQNWEELAYVKVDCQNMKEHHSRQDDCWKQGLGWPAWKGEVKE